MNISASRIKDCRERGGSARSERPDYVHEALMVDTKLGWKQGAPVVEPLNDYDTPRLGDDVSPLYNEYPRDEGELLTPSVRQFIVDLMESERVQSLDDAAEELPPSIDVRTVGRAVELHGVDVPGGEGTTENGDDDVLELPSGEGIPLELLKDPVYSDSRVLTQLLAMDGLSVDETARYLSDELNEDVSPAHIRRSAEEANLLTGKSSDPGISTHDHGDGKTKTAGERGYARSPWD